MNWKEQFSTFCRNLTIDSKEEGTIPLRLNGCQRYFVDEVGEGMERGIRQFVILKGRQLGITTVSIALDLFWGFKHPGLQGGILFDTDSNKEKFRDTIDRYIKSLPRQMKAPPKAHNRYQLVFKNRSDYQYMVAGTRTSNDSLGRAKALNFLHSTECGFYADQDGLDTLSSSLAEKNPMRLYVFESTANGFNAWYDMCMTAKRAIRQKFIFIGWWRKEEYCFDPEDREYQVYWEAAPHYSKKEAEWIRKIKQYYDFDISPGQISWYRWHLLEQKKGDEILMKQEYPATEDEAFVVAGSEFFTAERLTNVYLECRKGKYDSYRYVTGSEFQFTQIHRTNAQNAELKIWEEPRPEGIYVMGADPAYGSSEWADRFGLSVFRCFADRIIQVAEYCTADIACYQFAWIIAHLGGAYRNVILNLEITGPGGAVSTELMHLQRSAATIPAGTAGTLLDVMGAIRHYFWMRPDNQLSGSTRSLHTKMDEYTKRAIMNSYKDSFEVGRMELRSTELLNEMRTVVQGGDRGGVRDQGSIGAAGRAKDDRVMAAALAHWVWIQGVRTQLTGQRLTYASAMRQSQSPIAGAMQRGVLNYLKRSGIGIG
jgi:hypothetical protein